MFFIHDIANETRNGPWSQVAQALPLPSAPKEVYQRVGKHPGRPKSSKTLKANLSHVASIRRQVSKAVAIAHYDKEAFVDQRLNYLKIHELCLHYGFFARKEDIEGEVTDRMSRNKQQTMETDSSDASSHENRPSREESRTIREKNDTSCEDCDINKKHH